MIQWCNCLTAHTFGVCHSTTAYHFAQKFLKMVPPRLRHPTEGFCAYQLKHLPVMPF